MSAHSRYMQYRKDELYHFNPNHSKKDGRFISGRFGFGNVTASESTYSKRPLTSSVKARTEEDKNMIAQIQAWDDNERKHIFRGNQIANNAKIMGFKIGRVLDGVEVESGLPVMNKEESKQDSTSQKSRVMLLSL